MMQNQTYRVGFKQNEEQQNETIIWQDDVDALKINYCLFHRIAFT